MGNSEAAKHATGTFWRQRLDTRHFSSTGRDAKLVGAIFTINRTTSRVCPVSSIIRCPECKRKLNLPEAMAGKSFRCPACKSIIPPMPKSRPAASELESDEPDAPTPSRLVKTRDAAVPPRRRPPQDEEAEEDTELEEARPAREKPLRKNRPKRKKSSAGLIIGLVAGGVMLLLLVLGVGGGVLWYFLRNKTIPQSEWQTFSPPNGGCTVLMPGTPTPQTLNILGISAKTYQVERKKEDAYFALTIFDISPPFLRPSLLEDVARSSRDGAKSRMDAVEPGSKVTSESAISLGNLPGREYQLTPPPTKRGTFITRLYLAKIGNTHRIFLVMAGGSIIQPNKGDAARFFDSFKIDDAATPPTFGGAAKEGGAKPPPDNKLPQANPQPNPPRPDPGPRPPRMPRRQPKSPSGPVSFADDEPHVSLMTRRM